MNDSFFARSCFFCIETTGCGALVVVATVAAIGREENEEEEVNVDKLSVEIDGCTLGLDKLALLSFDFKGLVTLFVLFAVELKVTLTVRLQGMGAVDLILQLQRKKLPSILKRKM